jgi:hypothetical protein
MIDNNQVNKKIIIISICMVIIYHKLSFIPSSQDKNLKKNYIKIHMMLNKEKLKYPWKNIKNNKKFSLLSSKKKDKNVKIISKSLNHQMEAPKKWKKCLSLVKLTLKIKLNKNQPNNSQHLRNKLKAKN